MNEIDGDDSSDNELCTKELLDKYEKAKDSQADPDYAPLSSEDLSSEEISSEADTEEEKTESQKKLNGGLKWKTTKIPFGKKALNFLCILGILKFLIFFFFEKQSP